MNFTLQIDLAVGSNSFVIPFLVLDLSFANWN